MMYNFAKESKSINEDAPFVRFNCADYADNPQLVVAQIFGVKKELLLVLIKIRMDF